ncbi:MAG TPA: GNAT family N-acetyltransferase [Myxococcota bacterium]|nr:GNAT family N-acetyltransferase [Myxococcota bacterium]
MDVSFRSAGPADLETVVPLVRDFWVIEQLEWAELPVRRALAGLLADARLGHLVLMERAGRAIGYYVLAFGYSLEFHGRDAFIDELFVREAERGTGIGTRALAHAVELCASLGVHAVHLEADWVNPRARKLYEKNGFRVHERTLMTKKTR